MLPFLKLDDVLHCLLFDRSPSTSHIQTSSIVLNEVHSRSKVLVPGLLPVEPQNVIGGSFFSSSTTCSVNSCLRTFSLFGSMSCSSPLSGVFTHFSLLADHLTHNLMPIGPCLTLWCPRSAWSKWAFLCKQRSGRPGATLANLGALEHCSIQTPVTSSCELYSWGTLGFWATNWLLLACWILEVTSSAEPIFASRANICEPSPPICSFAYYLLTVRQGGPDLDCNDSSWSDNGSK